MFTRFGFKLLGIPRLPTTNWAIAYSLKATSLSTSIHDGYASLPTQADYIPMMNTVEFRVF